jgi:type II secretory pathway component PulF
MGSLLITIAAFCLVFILPKFKDIYDQLGAELPAPTQALLDLATALSNGWAAMVINLFWVLALAFFIVRGIMNGTRVTKLILTLTFAGLVWSIVMGASAALVEFFYGPYNPGPNAVFYQLLISLACLLVVLLLVPYLLEGVEASVLRMERRFRKVLRFLPIAGRAVRVEQQARWLGALSLGLSSGVPPDQAVRAAGMICDGPMERRSLYASELVAAGHPIGRACVQARVLQDADNHRLALLDGRSDYLQGLRSIAADNAQMAYEWLQRSGRVAEISLLIILGLMAGMFAIAMYLPLFNIPQIVGIDR